MSTLNGREVIVAIIGGTMLALALTRPQLRWLKAVSAGQRSCRLWAERTLTAFSFAMAGYAAFALLLALHGQLRHEIDALLQGAAYFLAIYAGLVHYEPFVCEWRLGSGVRAFVLYIALVIPAFVLGAAIATLMLSSLSARTYIAILVICGLGSVTWLSLYTFSVRIDVSWRQVPPPSHERPTRDATT